jgi:hypothetical protein
VSWNEFFALVLNVESGKLGALNGGGIYSSNSVDGHTGQSGAHRTLHCSLSGACHVSQPLGF